MSQIRERITNKRVIASFISVSILTLLFLAGPVQAFILGLNVIGDSEVNRGENITFIASLDIQNMDKYLPVHNFTLIISGPMGPTPLSLAEICVFDVDGKNLDGCDGITVERTSVPSENEFGYGYSYGYDSANGYGYDFGYGYGYGYDYGYGGELLNFTYKITLDTTGYDAGDYSTVLKALIGDETFQKMGVQITIADWTGSFLGGVQEIDTGLGLWINMNSTGSGDISVIKYNSNPETGFGLPGLGKYFKIDADQAVLDGMGETELRVEYTDAEVIAAGIDETTLRLYYYNETSGSWEAYNSPKGGVNTGANYVWAKTNHFSTWGVFGSLLEEEEPKTYSSRNNRFSYDPFNTTDNNSGGDDEDTIYLNGEDILGLEGDDVPGNQSAIGRFFSAMTGAVIGGGATTWSIAIIFVLLIGGGFTAVRIRRKRKLRK